MNNRGVFIAHAIRGPIVLITIGVLFAMHQAGVLTIDRTWPLILIVIGLMRLIARMAAPPLPYGQGPYAGAPPYGQPYTTTPPGQTGYGQPGYPPPPPPPNVPGRPPQ